MNFRLGIAALLALLAAPTTVTAAESWRMVNTPHFRVLSQASDRQTAKWIHDFELFISATSEAVSIKPKTLPPLTILLFANDRAYTPYKLLRPDGKPARVAGQFVTMGGASTIALALDSEQAETRRTIFHEATHWLMSGDPDPHPVWFTEGIAEMLSTFEQAGSTVSWAKPIDNHLLRLQEIGVVPLKDFLAQTDALKDQDRHEDRYYAQSWAFVHYLMLAKDPALRKMFDQYLAVYRNNPGDAAVREAFGDKLPAIELDFNRYVRQQSFSFLSLKAAPIADPPASVPAPPAIVEAALGFMALGTGRNELAQKHAKRAAELSPELPDGHQVLAYLASQDKDFAAIRKHAEAALETGSRDSQIYLLMGDSLGRDKQGDYEKSATARIGLYHRALQLSPARRELYLQLAGDLMFQDKPQAEDLHQLQLGQRLFPDDHWIKVAVATTQARLGGEDRTLQSIQMALRPGSKLSSEQRYAVGTLRTNLLMQAMDAELRVAQEKRDNAGARAIIARYRGSAGNDQSVLSYLQRRDQQFEMNQLVERVNLALRNRNPAELNPLFEQILAHPAVTPQLRNLVETTRRGLQ